MPNNMLIRDVDPTLKLKIRIRAVNHGHSIQEEVVEILRGALAVDQKPSRNLGRSINERFAALGGFAMPEIAREAMPEPPEFAD